VHTVIQGVVHDQQGMMLYEECLLVEKSKVWEVEGFREGEGIRGERGGIFGERGVQVSFRVEERGVASGLYGDGHTSCWLHTDVVDSWRSRDLKPSDLSCQCWTVGL
jgi:hypothetical protein